MGGPPFPRGPEPPQEQTLLCSFLCFRFWNLEPDFRFPRTRRGNNLPGSGAPVPTLSAHGEGVGLGGEVLPGKPLRARSLWGQPRAGLTQDGRPAGRGARTSVPGARVRRPREGGGDARAGAGCFWSICRPPAPRQPCS